MRHAVSSGVAAAPGGPARSGGPSWGWAATRVLRGALQASASRETRSSCGRIILLLVCWFVFIFVVGWVCCCWKDPQATAGNADTPIRESNLKDTMILRVPHFELAHSRMD